MNWRMHLVVWIVLCKVILLMILFFFFFPWDFNIQIAEPSNLRGEMPHPHELEQNRSAWTSVPLKTTAMTCSPSGAFAAAWNQHEIPHFVPWDVYPFPGSHGGCQRGRVRKGRAQELRSLCAPQPAPASSRDCVKARVNTGHKSPGLFTFQQQGLAVCFRRQKQGTLGSHG